MSNNKKLINSNYIKDINNKEMTDNEKQKVEISNNVSNKEALNDKIHEIARSTVAAGRVEYGGLVFISEIFA